MGAMSVVNVTSLVGEGCCAVSASGADSNAIATIPAALLITSSLSLAIAEWSVYCGMPNRWLPVFGGILMNLALGSLYAWSVFVPPLEREFGWTRVQTSWVYTIAIVCFAS